MFYFKVKFTKIFDLTDSNNTGSKVHGEDDDEQLLKSEWDAMPTTGTKCHECLELFWETEEMPRCVCFQINNQHDHYNVNHQQYQHPLKQTIE